MRHLYLFYLLLMINGLHSQNFEWVKAFGGLGNQHINDIVIDSFDNVYVFGDFENTVDFNASPEETFNLTSIEGYNAFLAKYDSDGNFLWAEQIESSYLIDIDKVVISANSILVVGGFIGSVNFQTETETIALNSPSKNKMFLAKYNLDGNLQWVKYWGNSTAHIGARDVVIDSQNNIHICGHYGDGVLRPNTNSNTPAFSAIQDKGFWIEIDESGNYLDSKTFGDPNNSWYTYDRVQSIKFDDFGNSIITGNFRGSFDFDFSSEETIVQSHENGSNFIAKYHSTGSLLWVKNVDLIEPNDLQLDSNNDIYTTGKFYGTVDVDLSPNSEYILSAPASYYDNYLLKLNEDGNFTWAFSFGGNYGPADNSRSVLISGNNLLIAGSVSFEGDIDFDPDPNSDFLIPVNNLSDVFLAKYNTDGEFSWAFTLSGDQGLSSASQANKVVLDNQGKVYAIGTFNSTVDFDPGNEQYNITSIDEQDMFLMKLDGNLLSVEEETITNSIKLYPNPVNDYLYLDSESQIKSLVMYDLTGKIIFERNKPAYNVEINLKELTRSTFFIKISTEQGEFWKKILKQ